MVLQVPKILYSRGVLYQIYSKLRICSFIPQAWVVHYSMKWVSKDLLSNLCYSLSNFNWTFRFCFQWIPTDLSPGVIHAYYFETTPCIYFWTLKAPSPQLLSNFTIKIVLLMHFRFKYICNLEDHPSVESITLEDCYVRTSICQYQLGEAMPRRIRRETCVNGGGTKQWNGQVMSTLIWA